MNSSFLSLLSICLSKIVGVIESRFVSDVENSGFGGSSDDGVGRGGADAGNADLRDGHGAAAEDAGDAGLAAERCIWPGCTRSRAPGRVSGSGRQKEYCLQADPPEQGGGPVHNARNRWAALRSGGAAHRAGHGPVVPGYRSADWDGLGAVGPGTADGPHPPPDAGEDETARDDSGGGERSGAARATSAARQGGSDGGTRGPFAPGSQGHGGRGESAASVREPSPFSSAKRRAGELLEQARRQHAAALASLRAERELYQRFGDELAVLADPAAVDLEIATVAARAGRHVAQAEQDAADARRAQLAAERERAEAIRLRAAADDAAEQLTEDATEAERLLAERTAGFERDLADLIGRARAAEEAERAAQDEATAVRAAAEAATAAARDRAEQATASLAEVLRGAELARERAGQEIASARDQAAAAVAAAQELARQQTAAAQARADDLVGHARADAEREREAARQARDEAARVRAEDDAAREAARQAQADAEARTTAARSDAVTAAARADALADELSRLRAELGRRDAAHAAELARLAAAHQAGLEAERALLGAERARARRAEDELDAGRAT